MMSKNRHVVPHGNDWAVRKEGASRVSSTHPTQQAAIDSTKQGAIRDHAEVVIHRPDGRIRDKDSYGNDPCPPRDNQH